MRLIILLTLFIGFFGIAHAEQGKKMVRVKTKKSKPLILMTPKTDIIPLEAIKISAGELNRGEIESRLRSGGDDVGNGGDEIRRQILEALPELSTKSVAVVSNLTFNGEEELAVHTPEGLLLNKERFKHLIKKNYDFRFVVLEVLHAGNRNKALELYSNLNALKNHTPYCDKDPSPYKLEKYEYTETIKGEQSTSELSKQALALCEKKNLYNCRIKETGKKGFASAAKNFSTYIGFEIKRKVKNSIELKQSKCILLKSCEEVLELAPIGQVTIEAFDNLELEIQKSCF